MTKGFNELRNIARDVRRQLTESRSHAGHLYRENEKLSNQLLHTSNELKDMFGRLGCIEDQTSGREDTRVVEAFIEYLPRSAFAEPLVEASRYYGPTHSIRKPIHFKLDFDSSNPGAPVPHEVVDRELVLHHVRIAMHEHMDHLSDAIHIDFHDGKNYAYAVSKEATIAKTSLWYIAQRAAAELYAHMVSNRPY